MKPKWTPAQREAIDARGQDILVSAAAGSGKTAVLTRRIIERITDPNDPLSVDELLVVTFSKAAANELQVRIRAAIEEQMIKEGGSRRLRRQLLLLERAEISTIHSFCLTQIRKNASLLSLPVSMRVCDDSEQKRLRLQIMEQVLADYYKVSAPDFLELVSQFAVLSDDQIADLLLKLYEKTTSLPEGVAYFAKSARQVEESIGAGLMSGTYGKLLRGYLESYLNHYEPLYARVVEMMARLVEEEKTVADPATAKERAKQKKRLENMESMGSFYKAEWESLSSVLAYADDYDSLAAAMQGVNFLRKPTLTNPPDGLSEATGFRGKSKEQFIAFRDRYFPTTRPGALSSDLAKTARLLWVLAKLMEEFENRFTAEKQRLGIMDYSDLERYTHRLLIENGAPTPIAKALSRSYREIYIDEYQDVNRLQDDIFSAIANGNRFMVGDIKQSIYGFRGAEPSIFAEYRSRFDNAPSDSGEGKTIYLSHNFRCDQSVVDFVNLVCEDLFMAGGTVSYQEGDRLIRGKGDDQDGKKPVQVVLLQSDDSSEGEEDADSIRSREAEAEYIASEVERLWKVEGIPLRDMAVIMRSLNTRITPYEEALKQRGIPCVHNRAMPFFEEPEILTLLSLLYTIDNPTKDIYLAGALTGPVFGFTTEEVIAYRWEEGRPATGVSLYETVCAHRGDPRVDAFLAWLDDYRKASCTLSSDELIRKLYAETALSAIVGADPVRGKAAEQNLRSFYQLARTFEKNNFRGLHRFLRYVGDLAESGQGVERQAELGDADAIQLMTIHHSKGLEFRVCFLADTGSKFSQQDSTDEVLFHRQMGMTLTLRDPETLGKYQTLPRQILSEQITEDMLEEEMRNLYVAMTRAKERLYVTAWIQYPKSSGERWASLADRFTFWGVKHAASYIDWIMGVLGIYPDRAEKCSVVRRYLCDADGLHAVEDLPESLKSVPVDANSIESTAELSPSDDLTVSEEEDEAAKEMANEIAHRFDFVYPHSALSDLPAKLTVSRLSPVILDAEEDSASLHGVKMKKTPAFLQTNPDALSGAERGTATHLFMQFCDFDAVDREGVETELLRLVNRQFISPILADAVNLSALRNFFQSALYRQMRESDKVLREFRFNVQLPAKEFTAIPKRQVALEDAKLLVQGVVDCCFILPDGSVKLVDYKTDRLGATPEEGGHLLWERYADQLFYYKKALEAILHRSVSALSLYSFCHNTEYLLPENLSKAFGVNI
ncbi:MAG: helicase-exonuclease AddAB subunit AddA [Clostridia bacterium]|nr:helicase-exonuclease AddAB subunit AddA [Clostridia bacterium]